MDAWRRTSLAVVAALVLGACSPGTAEVDGADVPSSPTPPGPTATPDAATPDATTPDATTPAAAGAAVPPEPVESFAGETVSLAGVGVPQVINFWASWCPPCIAEMPDLQAVHEAVGEQVRFVGVNTQDTPELAADLVEETGVTYDLVRDPDGELFQAFGVFGMPSTFYVAADGTIVDRHTGLLTRDALVADLQEHLGVTVVVAE